MIMVFIPSSSFQWGVCCNLGLSINLPRHSLYPEVFLTFPVSMKLLLHSSIKGYRGCWNFHMKEIKSLTNTQQRKRMHIWNYSKGLLEKGAWQKKLNEKSGLNWRFESGEVVSRIRSRIEEVKTRRGVCKRKVTEIPVVPISLVKQRLGQ